MVIKLGVPLWAGFEAEILLFPARPILKIRLVNLLTFSGKLVPSAGNYAEFSLGKLGRRLGVLSRKI
jgi:hypothetical protein